MKIWFNNGYQIYIDMFKKLEKYYNNKIKLNVCISDDKIEVYSNGKFFITIKKVHGDFFNLEILSNFLDEKIELINCNYTIIWKAIFNAINEIVSKE